MLLAIQLATLIAVGEAAHAKRDLITIVDGATYRVRVRGEMVMVAKKAFSYRFSIEERERMRRAAMQATGCEVTDEMQSGGKLLAKVKCSTTGDSGDF